ncbi:XdhC family protein [Pseudalkalibacillus caeni]|uniref:XdhC Rossmann domain-containing protein n=1 Tax=Exobacillus caeni TaxID=2574798 RepID=A0A5R9FB81_9BACL|nr:XdhC family protein [Pseudalkalibacillus caeni]TLS38928.1 hypothetical protein FCL54_01045 [Pseudalkalibacillus caeni]
MSQTMYKKLSQSLQLRQETVLVTITECLEHRLIGKKILLWPSKSAFDEGEIPLSLMESINLYSQPLLKKKRSGVFQFSWKGNQVECFAEYFPAPVHLIVAGAGHVGEPVASIGKMLGFYVTVIDDRPDYANLERFPIADEVICESFMHYFRDVPLTDHTYILLLTRGHKYDVLSLQELLRRKEKAAYIGMIGSRRRISGVFEQVKQEFPDETFDHIYTPVGLDIGAETPSEIAVSIMAEILKIKNGASGNSLSSKIRRYAKMGFHEGAVK